MILPVQVTFRNTDPSAAVEQRVHEEAEALNRYFDRITSCRVMVEAPHRHHQHGQTFHVTIELGVPGSKIIVNHEPSLHSSLVHSETGEMEKRLEAQPDHKDVFVSIRDAFTAARRQLEDYVSVLRGEVKRHERPAETPGMES